MPKENNNITYKHEAGSEKKNTYNGWATTTFLEAEGSLPGDGDILIAVFFTQYGCVDE